MWCTQQKTNPKEKKDKIAAHKLSKTIPREGFAQSENRGACAFWKRFRSFSVSHSDLFFELDQKRKHQFKGKCFGWKTHKLQYPTKNSVIFPWGGAKLGGILKPLGHWFALKPLQNIFHLRRTDIRFASKSGMGLCFPPIIVCVCPESSAFFGSILPCFYLPPQKKSYPPSRKK